MSRLVLGFQVLLPACLLQTSLQTVQPLPMPLPRWRCCSRLCRRRAFLLCHHVAADAAALNSHRLRRRLRHNRRRRPRLKSRPVEEGFWSSMLALGGSLGRLRRLPPFLRHSRLTPPRATYRTATWDCEKFSDESNGSFEMEKFWVIIGVFLAGPGGPLGCLGRTARGALGCLRVPVITPTRLRQTRR